MERNMEFFKGVFQLDAELSGEKVKFPVFYYDNSAITGIFLARVSKLRKIMPSKNYYPLTVLPGVGLIAITAFEYRDTDIKPYNELSISIPMSYKSRPFIPATKMLSSLFKDEFHVYIHKLPVTTKLALDGGVILYNFPKFLAQINFEQKGDEVSVKLMEKDSFILSMKAQKIKTDKSKKMRYVTYPVKDGNPQHADILINAINFGISYNPTLLSLELGNEHPIAKELNEIIIYKKAIQYQYIPSFQAILYGPSRLE